MTITTQEDKEVSVFTETSRQDPPPPPLQYVIYMATLQIPKPYYMYNTSINNQPRGQQLIKQSLLYTTFLDVDDAAGGWGRGEGGIHLDKCVFHV